jgi:EAL domain-containing protein (putative c-di-GMP-specific phosphodiesterase class I)
MMDTPDIRILILDDDSFMLKLLTKTLAKLGFSSVTTCESGKLALEYVDSVDNQPDLILLDLNMPDMDGIEFIRKLGQQKYIGSLVLVSGEDERMMQTAEKLIQAHEIVVLGHLSKPISSDRLSNLLGKWSAPRPQAAPRKTYTAHELRNALLKRELINYYQPKVAVDTGEVIGVETLVRWLHPVDGLVYPDQFIGVAEEHGLIDNLTMVVLAEALAQVRIWRHAGLRLRVAVNVSMDNLSTVEFADFVASTAAIAPAVDPRDVVLEVTESRLMLDFRAPLEILTRLRLKRFRLSIDDFGTGNSSLSQLCDIPFDELKIDQRFVHGACHNATTRVMFEASLGLGKQLGMEVVAEGIEDREDWDFVRSTNCDLAQGYFITRPMPAAELPGWISSWKERMPLLQADEA